MKSNTPQQPVDRPLVDDLAMAFSTFPNKSLEFLRDNTDLLIRGVYQRDEFGCLFNLLSRELDERITSKEDLSMWFTGDRGEELRETSPLYLAARRVVQAWDGRRLGVDTVLFVVNQLLKGTRELSDFGNTEAKKALRDSSTSSSAKRVKKEEQQELALPF